MLGVIAALVSYKHMYLLVRRHGESSWTAALLPISVDGMIVAASMSLLLDSRHGRRSGLLPWILLILGSAASLAANVAVAEPSVVGRLIAGWPSCALIGSYELLMRQIRHAAVKKTELENVTSEAPHRTFAATHKASEDSHRAERLATAPSYEPLRNSSIRPKASEKSHSDRAFELIGSSGRPRQNGAADGARVQRSSSRMDRTGDGDIRRRAWQWAVAHRSSEGELPPGKAIGSRFGRSERWGRLVKQAGRAGRLDAVAS